MSKKVKHLPMNERELRKFYETVATSARVSENKKTYKRSRDKKVGDHE